MDQETEHTYKKSPLDNEDVPSEEEPKLKIELPFSVRVLIPIILVVSVLTLLFVLVTLIQIPGQLTGAAFFRTWSSSTTSLPPPPAPSQSPKFPPITPAPSPQTPPPCQNRDHNTYTSHHEPTSNLCLDLI